MRGVGWGSGARGVGWRAGGQQEEIERVWVPCAGEVIAIDQSGTWIVTAIPNCDSELRSVFAILICDSLFVILAAAPLGNVHWGALIGMRSLGCAHWDAFIGMRSLGCVHWDALIGMRSLG